MGVIAVILLVLLNGFFVATEFSLVAVRRTRLEQLASEGRRSARSALGLLERLDFYIAGCQFGITAASLALGWIGEPVFSDLIEGPLESVMGEAAKGTSHAISGVFAFVLITALHIVLGELAPKGIALQKTESVAMFISRPMRVFTVIFKAPIIALNAIGNGVLRLFGMKPASEGEEAHSSQELQLLLAGAESAGNVEASEAIIAARAVEFADHNANSLMTPRPDVLAISVDASADDLVTRFLSGGHTRMPVYRGTLDDVVGFVHLHDVLAVAASPTPDFAMTSIVREALVVPETAGADRVLTQLQATRNQLAVVVDEFGGTSGIVTLEDILEALVGRIEEERGLSDEPEEEHAFIETQGDGSFLIDGRARLDEVDEVLNTSFDDDVEDVETIAGVVITELGQVPNVGDIVETSGWRIQVTEMDHQRVARVLITRLPVEA